MARVNTLARLAALASIVWSASATAARAQNWSFDARQIALGSPVGGQNLASSMIADANGYRSIVLPFGLIQVIGDVNALNPSSDDFDLVRLMEDVASPIHYTFGRHSSNTGKDFVVDLRNAELNRDVSVYRGFAPSVSVSRSAAPSRASSSGPARTSRCEPIWRSTIN